MEHSLNPKEIGYIFEDFVASHGVDFRLKYGVSPYPWGFDPNEGTITVDRTAMMSMPDWAGILYLLYSLTRAWLLVKPDEAPKKVRDSVRYHLDEGGVAYLWDGDRWQGCRLGVDLARAAKSLPAHVWAVEYAMGEGEELMTDENEKDNLHRLAYMMQTGNPLSDKEMQALLEKIERALA